MSRRYGQIIRVSEDQVGSALVADTAAGAGTLMVRNAVDFDEDRGGNLSVNGQVIGWVKADDDTGEITLDGTLAADADEGDQVALYDTKRDVIVVERTALVDVGEGRSDAIHATVAAHLVRQLPEGPRGDDGESVVIELDEDDDWTVVDVLGLGDLTASGLQAEADDFYILTAADIVAGVATVPLSHRPADEWLVAFWRTVPQEPTEYTINYDAQTITWPLSGFETAGDRLWVHYAYFKGIASPAARGFSPLDIPSLVAWYSADYEATIYADGAAMSQWTDLSGKGNHAPLASFPIYLEKSAGPAGGPCIRYALGCWFNVPTGVFGAIPTAAEGFVTIKAMGTATGTGHWALTASSSSSDNKYPGTDGKIHDQFAGSGPKIFTPTMSVATWRRYNVRARANEWVARMDEEQQYSDPAHVPHIGGGPLGNRSLAGEAGDQTLRHGCAFLFDAILSADERAAMDQWLTEHPSGGRPA